MVLAFYVMPFSLIYDLGINNEKLKFDCDVNLRVVFVTSDFRGINGSNDRFKSIP